MADINSDLLSAGIDRRLDQARAGPLPRAPIPIFSPSSSCCSSPIATSRARRTPCSSSSGWAGRITACCTSSTGIPALRVADLLEILKITKQSLARVLKELVDQGWIVQKAGERDRRQRLLLCDAGRGRSLRRASTACSPNACREALAQAGPGSDDVAARFLFNMITKEERALVEALLPEPIEAATASRRK